MSRDAPSAGGDDRTIVRPEVSRASAPQVSDPATTEEAGPRVRVSEPTVFAFRGPGIAGSEARAGSAERTVIAGADWPGSTAGAAAPAAVHSAPLRGSERVDALFANPFESCPHPRPLMALAAPALLALGRLRVASPGFPDGELMAGFAAAIRAFEAGSAAAGFSGEQARMARYVLCETVDDVAGHRPGADVAAWRDKGMLAAFFGLRNGGAAIWRAG